MKVPMPFTRTNGLREAIVQAASWLAVVVVPLVWQFVVHV